MAKKPKELCSLRRVGRKHAKRIVAYRPFKRVQDLKQVLPRRVHKAARRRVTVQRASGPA